MVLATRAAPLAFSAPPKLEPTRPLAARPAFMNRDAFERATPAPAPAREWQPAPRQRDDTACNRILDVLLCPARSIGNWFTFILCCPCLITSACCMND